MDHPELRHLLDLEQDGVVSRRQLLDLGARPHDVERLLRRRDLTVVHPGVYVDHTGPLTHEQRHWAAVHAHWPAALTLGSALPGPPSTGPVQVAVDVRRSVRRVPGVVAHRVQDWATRVDPSAAPPRVTLEHATIDVASGKLRDGDLLGAFRLLTDVTHTRRTSAAKIRAVLDSRGRVPGRRALTELLDDLATGACSVLEREYLHAVERAHGLPRGEWQAPGPTTSRGHGTLRDVRYPAQGVLVELDGRAFHDTGSARDADHERDLDALVLDSAVTVRLTYGQVFGTPCRTAARLGVVLRRRGWPGVPRTCPRCPDPA